VNGLYRLLALLAALGLLTGCGAPLVLAGGDASGLATTKDRRDDGRIQDDKRIESEVQKKLATDQELSSNSHIKIASYNGVVLISGEALLPMYKAQAETVVQQTPKVRRLHNELRIAKPSDSSAQRNDALLTARVVSHLLGDESVDPGSIRVVSDNATVYLMGLVKRDEAQRAVDVVRTTDGVARIVKLFEYTEPGTMP